MGKFTIISTYTNPEKCNHIVIEEAIEEEWANMKYERQIDYFYYLLLGEDNKEYKDIEEKLAHLKTWCKNNNRTYDIRVKQPRMDIGLIDEE